MKAKLTAYQSSQAVLQSISYYHENLHSGFRELFDLFDTDGNGVIVTSEVDKILRMRGVEHKEEVVKGVIRQLDTDGRYNVWSVNMVTQGSVSDTNTDTLNLIL